MCDRGIDLPDRLHRPRQLISLFIVNVRLGVLCARRPHMVALMIEDGLTWAELVDAMDAYLYPGEQDAVWAVVTDPVAEMPDPDAVVRFPERRTADVSIIHVDLAGHPGWTAVA